MRRFSQDDPLCLSPIYKMRKWGREPGFLPYLQNAKMGGENLAFSPLNSVFWNLGEAGGGSSLI